MKHAAIGVASDRSAMFNLLVIVALSAAVAVNAGLVSAIDYRVVARDVAFYTFSIFSFVGAANDGSILWWEVSIYHQSPLSLSS